MKAYKVLRCSRNPICGNSVGQENRLNVTNPHTERFFKNLKNRPDVGGLVQANTAIAVYGNRRQCYEVFEFF